MSQIVEPPEPPGLRERKRRRTRLAIARAALELFDRQGFAETTIPQIAEAADVSPRTVSSYFPHKEELAFPRFEEALAGLEAGMADRLPGESAADVLRRWITAWIAEEGRDADETIRRRVIQSHESLRAYQHRHLLRARETMAKAFAQDLGVEPHHLEPRMAAAATLTIFELLGEHLEAAGDAAKPEDVLDRALLFVGGGIRALSR